MTSRRYDVDTPSCVIYSELLLTPWLADIPAKNDLTLFSTILLSFLPARQQVTIGTITKVPSFSTFVLHVPVTFACTTNTAPAIASTFTAIITNTSFIGGLRATNPNLYTGVGITLLYPLNLVPDSIAAALENTLSRYA